MYSAALCYIGYALQELLLHNYMLARSKSRPEIGKDSPLPTELSGEQ